MISKAEIRGFDFHCHVDLHPDPVALISQCEHEGIVVLAVTTTPRAWHQNKLWASKSPYVHPAVGLHPEVVGECYSEVVLLEQLISQSRFVGEIGLDGSPQYQAFYEKQKEVFSRALEAAQKHGSRIVTIHSRRAVKDTIALIERHTTRTNVLCILHWFTGSIAEAQRAAQTGCYFSVNAAMLSHQRGRTLIRSIPRDRLLTETDAPFAKVNGRKSVPKDMPDVATELAVIYSEQVSETTTRLFSNARRVWQFAGLDIDQLLSAS